MPSNSGHPLFRQRAHHVERTPHNQTERNWQIDYLRPGDDPARYPDGRLYTVVADTETEARQKAKSELGDDITIRHIRDRSFTGR